MELLKELLQEQSHEYNDIKKLAFAIMGAAPFFKQRENAQRWMYRGMHADMLPSEGFARTFPVRTNRAPKDSNPMLSEILDQRLHQDFGVPYRSASLFVTGDKFEARSYGHVGIVLPQGDFKFCYGVKCADAYKTFNISHAYDYIMDRGGQDIPNIELLKRSDRTKISEERFIESIWDNHEAKSLFYEWFDYTYQGCEYTDADLSRGLLGSREVMVACREYVVVPQKATIARWHVEAAEELVKDRLTFKDRDNVSIEEFITAMSQKVVPIINHS